MSRSWLIARHRGSGWAVTRKHQTLVASTIATLMLAVGGLSLGGVLLSREQSRTDTARQAAEDNLRIAERERRAARTAEAEAKTQRLREAHEAAVARDVSDFLSGLFKSSDPLGLEGLGFRQESERISELTAIQLLDRGAQTVEAVQREPEVQATLLALLGRVYTSLGNLDKAQPFLDEFGTPPRSLWQ